MKSDDHFKYLLLFYYLNVRLQSMLLINCFSIWEYKISSRYERASITLTELLPFTSWLPTSNSSCHLSYHGLGLHKIWWGECNKTLCKCYFMNIFFKGVLRLDSGTSACQAKEIVSDSRSEIDKLMICRWNCVYEWLLMSAMENNKTVDWN